MAWVYILRCSDGTLYVGHTDDIERREREHQEGRGGDYTRRRRPISVVYLQELPTLEDAIQREHQIKRWSGKNVSGGDKFDSCGGRKSDSRQHGLAAG